MAGWISRRPGNSSAQRMRDRIPELRGVPAERAREVYHRARARLKRRGAWWGASLVSALGIVAVQFLSIWWGRTFADRGAIFWIRALLPGVLVGLSVRSFFWMTHHALRRCVRAELGTHCSACDYDLRGTPDAIPPAIARCPECGKAIPRNVHRQTVGGSAPATPAAAALLWPKSSD